MKRLPLLAACLASLAAVLTIAGPSAAAAVTVPTSPKFLVIDSEPGDHVGQGQQLSFTTDTATFEAYQEWGTWVTIRVFPESGGFWVLHFAAPTAQKLVPGTYAGTRRSADADHAGLDIGGNGSGCGDSYGSFVINEASFDGDFGPVLSFDASFEQHCGSPDAPGLRGEVRYSTTPRPVPAEPLLVRGAGVIVPPARPFGLNYGSFMVDLSYDGSTTTGEVMFAVPVIYGSEVANLTVWSNSLWVPVNVGCIAGRQNATFSGTGPFTLRSAHGTLLAWGQGRVTATLEQGHKGFLYGYFEPAEPLLPQLWFPGGPERTATFLGWVSIANAHCPS
jgi:hypothetical protein